MTESSEFSTLGIFSHELHCHGEIDDGPELADRVIALIEKRF